MDSPKDLEISLQRQEHLRSECKEKVRNRYLDCRRTSVQIDVDHHQHCFNLIEDDLKFCQRLYTIDRQHR